MGHILIYSHGFGVRQDARGLFTAIASAFPDVQHVMFDYHDVAPDSQILTVSPLDQQATMLRQKVSQVRRAHPHATISLICHSQGCVVAALAGLTDIHHAIFLAPPLHLRTSEKRLWQLLWRRLRLHKKGLQYTRRDGTITVITPAFLKSRRGLKPVDLYSHMATHTKLTIIAANQDEVVGDTDFSALPRVQVISIDADHNFRGSARKKLLGIIKSLV